MFLSPSSSSWQFISLLFSQHKKIDDRIKTITEKCMQIQNELTLNIPKFFKVTLKRL